MPVWIPPKIRILQNREYIAEETALNYQFKKMQRSAKEQQMYQTMASAVTIVERLGGYEGLSAWILGQYDLEF